MDFDKLDGLIPAIIQDIKTKKVLMLGFMNEEAYIKTKNDGIVTFYSRTKKRLWTKGETSGNFLKVEKISEDCDKDTLLIEVIPNGKACHKDQDTCFGETNDLDSNFLYKLEELIHERKINMPEKSYTTHLFNKGVDKIAQKVGEEAVELVIEAKNENMELFLGEAADLMYHYIVLLQQKNTSLDDVIDVLKKRHQ